MDRRTDGQDEEIQRLQNSVRRMLNGLENDELI